jgi:ribosomal protein L34
MKKKIRKSATKKSKMSGFRTRNKTSSGKKIIARKRRKGTAI